MTKRKFTVTDVTRTPIPSIDLELNGTQQTFENDVTITANSIVPIIEHDPELYKIHNESDPNDNRPKCWIWFMKHWPVISQPACLLFIFICLWGIGLAILPIYFKSDTTIMRLIFLFIGSQMCGILVELTGLPDMLGMLFWGVLYKNVGWGDFKGMEGVEAVLRELALVNIMLLAGLSLELNSLKKLFGMIMRLTLIPTIAEVSVVAVLSYFLVKLPWSWGVLLGLVVTAVSPNVVVTILLRLKEERLGLNNGIHTIIIAMTSCNDVVAIFCFSVLLGMVFSTGNLTDQLLQGPIGIVLGVVYGFLMGLLLLFIPSPKSKYVAGLRFILMFSAGALSAIGSKAISYPSAGALGCIAIAFTAGTGWRRQSGTEKNKTADYLDILWKFLKPISFSLIGKEVYFAVLDGNIVLYGILILVLGSLFRLVFAYLSSVGGDLTWKERAYITLSSFPKATVQAALGPVALDLARQLNSTDNLDKANTILVISVLAIIMTAPLGAVLMQKLSTYWLKKSIELEEAA